MEWIVGYVSPLRKLMHGFPSHAQWCDEAPVGYKGDSMLFEQVVLWSGDTKHARRLHFEREVWYDWHHAHSSRIGSPHCLEAGWSQARREMWQPSNFTLGLLGLAGIRHWDSVPGVTQSILAQVGWLMIFFLGSHGMVARIFFCLPVWHLCRGAPHGWAQDLCLENMSVHLRRSSFWPSQGDCPHDYRFGPSWACTNISVTVHASFCQSALPSRLDHGELSWRLHFAEQCEHVTSLWGCEPRLFGSRWFVRILMVPRCNPLCPLKTMLVHALGAKIFQLSGHPRRSNGQEHAMYISFPSASPDILACFESLCR